jgi:hypothetical protein
MAKGLVRRVFSTARGDPDAFRAVKSEPLLTIEAIILVFIVGGLTALPSAVLAHGAGGPGALMAALGAGAGRALLAWVIVASAAFGVALFFFRTRASWRAVLVATAYATTPFLLPVAAGFSPVLAVIAYFVAASWALYLLFVALRIVLDIDAAGTVASLLVAAVTASIIFLVISAGSSGVSSATGVLWGPAIRPLCESGVLDTEGVCMPPEVLTPTGRQ